MGVLKVRNKEIEEDKTKILGFNSWGRF